MPEKKELKVGDKSPHFTLKSHTDEEITLSNYRGKKNVVLVFFPLAWTPV